MISVLLDDVAKTAVVADTVDPATGVEIATVGGVAFTKEVATAEKMAKMIPNEYFFIFFMGLSSPIRR